MNNFLEQYLIERYRQGEPEIAAPGPVVTLSREYGCEANIIAQKLSEKLTAHHNTNDQKSNWKIISKEILEASAQKLKTDSKKLEYVFEESRTTIDDFLLSLTARQYYSDWKIKETIKKVVHSFAHDGYVIIVGRAGAQITRDIQKALHVRLIAPFQWRVDHIAEKHNLSSKEAYRKVKEMDKKRQRLLETFSKDSDCHHCYDVHYNLKYLNTDQIVSDIVHMMQLKELI
ncbi:MAG: cytidylate kinase-like family protein [Bacteroidales bacterium]|jgi:cytidylate kinase|nr:cytidylate kinase-like family protein [Bacteroidales bacterium]